MKPWWWRLAQYGRRRAGGLTVVLGLMLAGVLFDVLRPLPMKLIVDTVLAGGSLPPEAAWIAKLPGAGSRNGLLVILTAGTVLLFLAGWLSRTVRAYAESGVLSRMAYDLGGDLFTHLQRLSLRFHGTRKIGDLVQRVTNDCDCIRKLFLGAALPLLTSLASLVMMFGVMWTFDWSLTLLSMTVIPGLVLVMRRWSGPMETTTFAEMEKQGELMALAEQTLASIPAVQVFQREMHEDRRFRETCREAAGAYMDRIAAQLKFKVGTSAMTAMGKALLMIIGGMHVVQGKLTVGGLLAFLSYLTSLYDPIETLAFLSAGFASAAAGARRVFDVLDVQDIVRESPHAIALPIRPEGRIRFDQVVFGYDPARTVLDGIDLEIEPGQTVALVGHTGAGKSTLVSLIPRFYDARSGCVSVDGRDVRELSLPSLRSQISFVLQEPFLLPLTIAANIAYGRPDASPQQIEAAAIAANADEFIRKLPMGYDTLLGDRGTTLSGGQRQRIAIARALLRDAPILILDEPTSALDLESEAWLLDALSRLMQNRTTVVIAHRLSTIRRADKIAVLDHGRIIECGTHAELIEQKGAYRRLYDLQYAPELTAPQAG